MPAGAVRGNFNHQQARPACAGVGEIRPDGRKVRRRGLGDARQRDRRRHLDHGTDDAGGGTGNDGDGLGDRPGGAGRGRCDRRADRRQVQRRRRVSRSAPSPRSCGKRVGVRAISASCVISIDSHASPGLLRTLPLPASGARLRPANRLSLKTGS